MDPVTNNPLTFDQYQARAYEFAVYSETHSVAYPLLGLVGEVGELVEQFLKLVDLPPGFTLPLLLRDVKRVCLEAGLLAKRLRDQGGFANGEEDGVVARAVALGVAENEDGWKALRKEGGDVTWFLAALCSDLGMGLGRAAEENLAKLRDRKNRGVIGGSGNDR
jgi:NTP pyrophosphatase (non-canonical NTP hydrolase)